MPLPMASGVSPGLAGPSFGEVIVDMQLVGSETHAMGAARERRCARAGVDSQRLSAEVTRHLQDASTRSVSEGSSGGGLRQGDQPPPIDFNERSKENRSMLDFEHLLRDTVHRFETWDGRDVDTVRTAVAQLEELVIRSESELRTLGNMPAAEGLGLWVRLMSLGAVTLAHLLSQSMDAEDSGDEERLRQVDECGLRLQAATHGLSSMTVRRLGQEARHVNEVRT